MLYLESLKSISDIRDVQEYYHDAHFWFLKYGVITNVQLKELISSKEIMETLRNLYKTEMPWRGKLLLDPLGISVWGSMLYIDGVNDIVIETIRDKLKNSQEYSDHHKNR